MVFKKLFQGLAKTRQKFSQSLKGLFTLGRRLDDDFIEELEEVLYSSDMGATAVKVIDEVRRAYKSREIKTTEEVYEFLKERGYLDLETLIHEGREDEWKQYRQADAAIDPVAIEALFARNLKVFVHLCRALGSTPVLMTQPNNGEDTKAMIYKISVFEAHARFNEVIRRVAAQEGADLIDLAKEAADPKYFYDFVHFNNYGSTSAARVIIHHFLARLKKPAEAKPPGE